MCWKYVCVRMEQKFYITSYLLASATNSLSLGDDLEEHNVDDGAGGDAWG